MLLSFTGTQHGMSLKQLAVVQGIVLSAKNLVAFHGGCIGADDEFDRMVAEAGGKRFVFPSTIRFKNIPVAVLQDRGLVTIAAPDQPLRRNRTVVRQGSELLATPAQRAEVLRSGTWATIRFAQRLRRRVTVVYPDGTVEIL